MKLSWMKLDLNILSSDKIKLIRKYPQGDSLFVLWIAILTKAMKSEVLGTLLVAKGTPYTPEDLAASTELDIKVVQLGLELFSRYGMITVDEYNTVTVTGLQDYQNIEAIESGVLSNRERQQRFRERQKQLRIEGFKPNSNGKRNVTVTLHNGVDIDIDKDIYKEQALRFDKAYANAYKAIGKEIALDSAYYKARNKILPTLIKEYEIDKLEIAITQYIKTNKNKTINLYFFPANVAPCLASAPSTSATRREEV